MFYWPIVTNDVSYNALQRSSIFSSYFNFVNCFSCFISSSPLFWWTSDVLVYTNGLMSATPSSDHTQAHHKDICGEMLTLKLWIMTPVLSPYPPHASRPYFCQTLYVPGFYFLICCEVFLQKLELFICTFFSLQWLFYSDNDLRSGFSSSIY